MKEYEELKKIMLEADKKCQELHGATPCVVWHGTKHSDYTWTCGSHAPDNSGVWEKVTEFNSYYLDNLYNSEEIETDFEKVWNDFVEYYIGDIDNDYNERIAAYNA